LLARYSGQEDIVVGTPIANRTQEEVEGLVGFFVNTLVLRGDLSGDPNFVELLSRVRESALGAYAHQDLPFEKLVEELHPERNLSHSPLFQVMFALQNAPRTALELGDLKLQALPGVHKMSKFDLSLFASEGDEGLNLTVEYNTDLFDADRMARLLEHFQTLLAGIIADPKCAVSRLPLLTERDRHQLLVEWNDTQADNPPACLHQLFQQQVDRTPDAVALVFEDRQLTYRELNARANQLAHYLRDRKVGPETLVGICAERSLEMVIGLLGILKAGGAYVPLDPAYPEERLQHMAQDAALSIVLTQWRLRERISASIPQVFCLDADWHILHSANSENPVTDLQPSNLAYAIYTSGSTGKPKGAMNTHRGITNRLLWMQDTYRLTERDRVLQKTPYSFDVSVWEFFWPLMAGACLVVAAPELHKDAAGLADLIVAQEITTLHFVPSMLQAFLEEEGVSRCRSLRQVICSGEALPAHLISAFYARLNAKLHNLYGPTEAAVDVTYWECPQGEVQAPIPIGRPVWNTQLYVLDRRMAPVPMGVPGELYLGGIQVGRGYLNRAELTAERFMPDPFSSTPGARLYRTGDLVRYTPDGNVLFLGRLDHQVKIRGFRIELGEIESNLNQHPGVREAVVLAREDVPGEKRLAAYLVAGEAGETESSELRAFLKERLPEYMIPSAWVWLEALPLSANGKVDRKALPAPEVGKNNAAYEAPSTPVEEALAKIWGELLRIEGVGVHDNFFELGGDSILIIRIISRANQVGLHFTPRQIFQHQTIAELASVAGTGAHVEADQGTVAGPVPLTPIQRWFFEQDPTDAHHFNQARMLQLGPSVTPEAVERAVQALVQRHDALRLRFVRTENGWEQTNATEETDPVFTYVDLFDVAEWEQNAAIIAECNRLQASLTLEAGPLLRAAYFDLGPEKPARLLLAIHHLAVDGVSWLILLEDLKTFLEAWTGGETPNLPSKTTSFQYWARKLQAHANSEAMRRESDYWLGKRNTPVQRIPVDFPSGDNTEAALDKVVLSLEPEETRELLQDVPAAYRTRIDDVLLTALARCFAIWTGERSLLVDLEGHGREPLFDDVDLSRTVGWFTSLYPVFLELPEDEDADPGEALKAVKEELRQIPNHGIGYGLLRYLAEDTTMVQRLASMPNAEVSFNYHGQANAEQSGPGVFRIAHASVGAVHSPRADRPYLIDVIGQVAEERLQVAWLYSARLHRRETIENLAAGYLEALRALIANCKAQETVGYTPSDFPDAQVSQQALDTLLASIRKPKE
ncbi:MAG TPA: amino acid adenylation domain-containing protein, partial [Chthonomonadaceae bacterium]|nr:amino acid adenylation domain-containing protein [Chthonomonadaceae bacterium]